MNIQEKTESFLKSNWRFALNEEEIIKLGFFNPLIGIVKVFSEDMISTIFPLFSRKFFNPCTCCAIPPIPDCVGDIRRIFTKQN